MVKLSIIILTYNSSQYIDPLLNSLVKNYTKELSDKELEIIVADNQSLDDTVEKVKKYNKKVKVIENGGNIGYAKGNNLGAQLASGEIIVFLNPDAKFAGGSLFELISIFNDETVGVVGGKIVSPNGKRELSCGKFYNPFNSLLLAFGLEESLGVRFAPDKYREVDFVSGGFLFIRKKLFEKIGGFDENYFMYVEDSDICYQVKKKGLKVVFSDKATINHEGHGSSNRAFAIVNIYKGLLYFNKKNGGVLNYLFVRAVLIAKAKFLVLAGRIMNNKYLRDTYNEALKSI